ncbi:hypothetical protein TWF718_004621 [Orbilia javanica]|uniref:Uncharacterized protein n=1 Tax=Orbilia javanica TaxID=47235 RepID=A0AAN8RFP6_9PEZI
MLSWHDATLLTLAPNEPMAMDGTGLGLGVTGLRPPGAMGPVGHRFRHSRTWFPMFRKAYRTEGTGGSYWLQPGRPIIKLTLT